ncbi:MAG: thiamine pyrophosphate-dependent enzyme, partial [Acidimicrobiia bacterium]
IGQESAPAAVCGVLRHGDLITSTHRGHGHVLAHGLRPRVMFAEVMGRSTGSCRGLGGSMHIADPSRGILGANGIVGGGLPIAVGAAYSQVERGTGAVVAAFFGDGAINTGAFHEAVNLAAVWKLPVLFVCENNGYAEFSPWQTQHAVPPLERARAYGVRVESVDGEDVEATARVATELVAAMRAGEGPAFLEVVVERWHGHYEGDPVSYRPSDEAAGLRSRDPLKHARARLSIEVADAIDASVEQEMDEALDLARADPLPELTDLSTYLWAPHSSLEAELLVPDKQWRYMDAIKQAMADAMTDDDAVRLAGIDVGGGGGIFRVTAGLYEEFGERVRDTPISESAIIGLAVGASMTGLRPIVELMFIDFLGVCFDQLMNQAAKLRFMTGGRVDLPMVVRTQYGAGRAAGAQHSQSLEHLIAAIPGLCVVMPSTPADAYGLLRTAIEDDNPVVFIEHRHLYGRKGPAVERDHRVPLGSAAIVRPGRHITVVATGRLVHDACAVAEELAAEGIDVEVIDLRCLVPLDRDTIVQSVTRTGRLAVCHEAAVDFGPGAEIVALVSQAAFWHLDAPPIRIAPPPVPAPYSPVLEQDWMPGRQRIADDLRRLMAT